MIINKGIIFLLFGFAVIGGIDRMLGNRWGLGEKFEEGLKTTGDLVITMLGMMILAPALANTILPVITPIYNIMGADPAMFAGSILANDMGGAKLAFALTENIEVAKFSGLIVGSMLGATISFTIPLGIKLLSPQNYNLFFLAICFGLIAMPLGCMVGGIIAGFQIKMLIINLIPIFLLVSVLLMGILKYPNLTFSFFRSFAWGINLVITIGLIVVFMQSILNIELIKNTGSLAESSLIIIQIGLILAGAFPCVEIIMRALRKPFQKIGAALQIDDYAVGGMIACLANSILTFKMVEKMHEKGKLVALSFCISAAFVFGDHLGFTAAFEPDMVFPVIIAKLVSGSVAVIIAIIYWNKVME